MWGGLQACVGGAEADSGRCTNSVPDTGSTPIHPNLPSIGSKLRCVQPMTQGGNCEPGEGSPEWGDFIRHLVEIYPDAVVEESESKEA